MTAIIPVPATERMWEPVQGIRLSAPHLAIAPWVLKNRDLKSLPPSLRRQPPFNDDGGAFPPLCRRIWVNLVPSYVPSY